MNTYQRKGARRDGQEEEQDPLHMLTEILRSQVQSQAASQEALRSIAANLAVHQPREDPTKLHRQFRDYHPPEFTGVGDPMVADSWILSVERIFDVMACDDEQKIRLASFLFTGEAGVWWRTTVQNYPTATTETWSQFKTRFNAQFFPAHVKDSLAEEFAALKQERLSVAQYGARFRTLFRYAPGYAATEEDRVRKFVDGLRPTLMASIIILNPQTLAEACAKAEVAERSERIVSAARAQSSANRNQPPPLKKQKSENENENVSYTVPVCPTCGKRHTGQCLRGRDVCYYCGDPNHKQYNCPRLGRQQNGTPSQHQPQTLRQSAPQQNQWRGNQNQSQNQEKRNQYRPLSQDEKAQGGSGNRFFALVNDSAKASTAITKGQDFNYYSPYNFIIKLKVCFVLK
ncbi:uncharacterized protein LOC143889989 [Tasmannia lanceolata]|uniref:uncharacterized protein LOC143885324 n=1 Tax=Tasmannia lanceolata TaxID=3420 RepID=UPI004062A16A